MLLDAVGGSVIGAACTTMQDLVARWPELFGNVRYVGVMRRCQLGQGRGEGAAEGRPGSPGRQKLLEHRKWP